MVTPSAAGRLRDQIVRLGHCGLTTAEFSRAVGRAFTGVVPAEGTCLMTVDPATLLPTAEYVENGLPAPALLKMMDIEVREPDVNKWVDLARSTRPAASMSAATDGDLNRSARQREIRRPGGFSDELRILLSTSTGTWGQLTVFREARRPYFTSADIAMAASLAGSIADGLRHCMLLPGTRQGIPDVGLIVLDGDGGVTQTNPAADRWLDGLGPGGRAGGRLPVVVSVVAQRARATADGQDDRPGSVRPAVARARTRSGDWLIVRGSLMGRHRHDAVTVIIEPARPAELASLMVQAYAFTEAESRVTELVARGLSTRQIARRLRVSDYTVQDHLKAVFGKSGTASRGDLVARLFVDHYADGLTGQGGDADAG